MALCLACSLVARRGFVPYDQLVRYKWWFRHGYMSSTGKCFDIGESTRKALRNFEERQITFSQKKHIPLDGIDFLSNEQLIQEFPVLCSVNEAAGNGALMRLAAVPLFFYRNSERAIKYSGWSSKMTHDTKKAIDACRYYGSLIVSVMNNITKDKLLSENYYSKVLKKWFQNDPLDPEIENIARGSFKLERGYEDGIRGKGYIVNSLEAALWAFWKSKSYRDGALAAVNLGDDTDTTAAIYGQLAGAYYGFNDLPKEWVECLNAKDFIKCLSKWIAYEGNQYESTH